MRKYFLILFLFCFTAGFGQGGVLIANFAGGDVPIPTDSLIAYYNLDSGPNDFSGNGFNGTNVNSPDYTAVDRFGGTGAMKLLSASQNYIQLPAPASPFDGSDSIKCISAWIKFVSTDASDLCIPLMFSSTTQANDAFRLNPRNNNTVESFIRNGTSAQLSSFSGSETSDTLWHHYVFQIDDTARVHYKDAVYVEGEFTLAGSGAKTWWIDDVSYETALDAVIGVRKRATSIFSYYNGIYDDIRYYADRKTQAEITTLYEEGGYGQIQTDYIAYYPFNGNANDGSGNSHNGTVTGAYIGDTLDRFDQTDNCYYFDGSEDVITISNDPDFSFGDASTDVPFSFSFWIKPADRTSKTIIYKGSSDRSEREYQIVFTSGADLQVRLFDLNSSNSIDLETNHTFNIGEWVHVVFTYDGSSNVSGLKFYMDGVYDNDGSTSTSGSYTAMHTELGDLLLGNFGTLTSFDYNGVMDDIRIYDRIIRVDEIKALYEEGGYTP